MKKFFIRKYSRLAVLGLLTVFATLPLFAAEIPEENRHYITTQAEWDSFAEAVQNGETYANHYFELKTDDIVVTNVNQCGSVGFYPTRTYAKANYFHDPIPFSGIFNGAGKTITYNIENSEHSGLFQCLKDAVIINLNVKGTVKNGGQNGGGLACLAYGNTTIANCRVSISFYASGPYSSPYVAGAIGGNLVIKNCLFDGQILNFPDRIGGFVGFHRDWTAQHTTLINCYFNPSMVNTGSGCSPFIFFYDIPYDVTLENCFYTKSIGKIQGEDASSYTPEDLKTKLGTGWKIITEDGIEKLVPDTASKDLANAVITNVDYFYKADSAPAPVIVSDTLLTEGTDYELTYGNGTTRQTKTSCDIYCITANAIGSTYTGSLSFEYYVADEIFSAPTGFFDTTDIRNVCGFNKSKTKTSCWSIKTPGDMKNLSRLVNAGNDLYGYKFLLEEDLDYENIPKDPLANNTNYMSIGTGNREPGTWQQIPQRSFAGSFDGQNHTISGIVSAVKDTLGLFGIIGQPFESNTQTHDSSIVIQNIILKNSTFIGQAIAGAIAGQNGGSSEYTITNSSGNNGTQIQIYFSNGIIKNCHVGADVTVGSTNRTAKIHGGIVGYNCGVIQGCSSAAAVTNNGYLDCEYYGGIAGQNGSTSVIKHCFYYGTTVEASVSKGAICGNNSGTFTDNLYKTPDLKAVNSADISGTSFAYAVRGEDSTIKIDVPGLAGKTEYSDNYQASDSMIILNNVAYLKYIDSSTSSDFSISYSGDVPAGYRKYTFIYEKDGLLRYNHLSIDENNQASISIPNADITVSVDYGFMETEDGSADNPYTIKDGRQFKYLAKEVNYGDADQSNKYLILGNNIEFDSKENNHTPIGGYYNNAIKKFAGNFDGKGYKISGINIRRTNTDESGRYAAFFGILDTNAAICNLIIETSEFTGYSNAGAIAGSNSGTIKNCKISDSVNINFINSDSVFHGGAAGYNTGIIEGVLSRAKVKGAALAGGIAGYNKGTVKNCFYDGSSSDVSASISYYGAIAGKNDSTTGFLSTNLYYTTAELKAVGTASAGKDTENTCSAHKISPYSDYINSINFAGTPVTYGTAGLNVYEDYGMTYDGRLFGFKDKTVKLNPGYKTLPEGSALGYISNSGNEILTPSEENIYSFTMPSDDVTIIPCFTINFDSNGGSTVQPQIAGYNQTLQNPATPVKEGGSFEGWYTDSSCTNKYDFTSTITAPLTLYANYAEGLTLHANADAYTDSLYYTSFYNSRFTYKVDANSKVYYVTKSKTGKLLLEQEESGIINAGQAVIIQSTGQNISLVLTEERGLYSYPNLLRGTDTPVTAPEGSMILGTSSRGGTGFYRCTGTIGANKAYIIREAQ